MERKDHLNCFTELSGLIDNCSCKIEDVDQLNNQYINSRINEITLKTYFRYYKLHVHRLCKERALLEGCSDIQCHVKKEVNDSEYDIHKVEINICDDHDTLGNIKAVDVCCEHEMTLEWEKGDCDACHCIYLKRDTDEMIWVDLMLNPEQHTGYHGNAIWEQIYNGLQSQSSTMDLSEKRVLYRAVSGLHASISTHLCYKYVLNCNSNTRADLIVAPNLEEFNKRFDPETTNALGPSWLRNMYFTYVVVLQAITKAESYWKQLEIDKGDIKADKDMKMLLIDLINVSKTCPNTFKDTVVLNHNLNDDFVASFKNISAILDHVDCERCRLWGKLQASGVATAFKILLSFDEDKHAVMNKQNEFSLSQKEVVSLFNTLNKLSDSLIYVNKFKTSTNKCKWWMLFSNSLYFRGIDSHIDLTLKGVP